ncbi:MAG: Coenzyme F420 hydrogenase/dehydrogenase, beta subunit C-terminal domain [Candidatus Bathyarchaeia archaeon]
MAARVKVFGSLVAEVINAGLCMYCGTCIASCPVNILFHSDEEKPVIKGVCVLCELCYYSCPRVEFSIHEAEVKAFGKLRTFEEQLGVVRKSYMARAKDEAVLNVCQDGGVVTALAIHALESGFVDLAILTGGGPETGWRPQPLIASNRAEALRGAGSKYSPGGSVSALGEAAVGYPNSKIMYVGLPCQIQGLRRLSTSNKGNRKLGERVTLTMGLFCMDIYHYRSLMEKLSEAKVNLSEVTKFDIKSNIFKAFQNGKTLFEAPIKDLDDGRMEGCGKCQDFTAELADISVGSVASPEGWCTVLVRSEKGEALFNHAIKKGVVEAKEVKDSGKLELLVRLSDRKRRREAPYLKLTAEA